MFLLQRLILIALLVFGAGMPPVAMGQAGNWVRPVTPEDVVHAVQWVKYSAEQGMPWAEYMLGTLYETGRGVPQDFSDAAKWYARAASEAEAPAAYRLGLLHYQGMGVLKDDRKALELFLLAAEQGLPEGQAAVGDMHALGRGVPMNVEQAVHWWQKGADGGVPDARFNLGMAAALGRGMDPNPGKAGEWLFAAALHFLELGRPADALRCLEGMRETVPEHPRTAELSARLSSMEMASEAAQPTEK